MSMIAQLPEELKQQVIRYLQRDNFPAAKALVDNYKHRRVAANDSENQIRVHYMVDDLVEEQA